MESSYTKKLGGFFSSVTKKMQPQAEFPKEEEEEKKEEKEEKKAEEEEVKTEQIQLVKHKAVVKSITELERLFKVDIFARSQTEIEVVLQFVNKERNPQQLPHFKRYRLTLDRLTQEFLKDLEK